MRTPTALLLASLLFAGAAHAGLWLPTDGPGQPAMRALAFRTPLEGLAVGEGNAVLRTADGGLTWTELDGGFISDGWYDVELTGASEVWTVGRNAIFQPMAGHSLDDGATWDYAAFYIRIGDVGYEGVARGVALSGGSVLVAATTWDGQGAVVSSTDGGAAFVTRLVLPDALAAIDAEGLVALAVGAHGTVLRSNDGGATWLRVFAGTTQDLAAVRFLDASRAVAVGNGGAVARSADAGATWEAVQVPGSPGLRGVAFASPAVGYAVGLKGAAFKTVDGGATWLPDLAATRADLLAVEAHADGALVRGSASGAAGTLLFGLDVLV